MHEGFILGINTMKPRGINTVGHITVRLRYDLTPCNDIDLIGSHWFEMSIIMCLNTYMCIHNNVSTFSGLSAPSDRVLIVIIGACPGLSTSYLNILRRMNSAC